MPSRPQAQDLYVSALFRKARAHVEAMDRPWYILSAEHGLLKPSDWVAPYDRRLSACPPEYRAAWAGWVVAKLTDAVGRLDGKVVEIHAGVSYVEPLLPLLQAPRGAGRGCRWPDCRSVLAWLGTTPIVPPAPRSRSPAMSCRSCATTPGR